MSIRPILLLGLSCWVLSGERARGAPARFWLSTSGSTTAGASVPTVSHSSLGPHEVFIWAQPATVSGGPFHSTQNPFRSLQNVSLNLVADSGDVSFLSGSIEVFNSVDSTGAKRFEFTHDSMTNLTPGSCGGFPAGLCGIQGFSVTPDVLLEGIGPTCESGDPNCTQTSSGSPAWLFAKAEFELSQPGLQANLILQLGHNGFNHAGESSLLAEAAFGNDAQLLYRAGRDLNADGLIDDHDREVTLPGDGPDLIIGPSLAGDYSGNGVVEQADLDLVLLNWGQPGSPPPAGWQNDLPSGNVDQGELDQVLLNWGASAALSATAGHAIPEPATATLLLLAITLVFSPSFRECSSIWR